MPHMISIKGQVGMRLASVFFRLRKGRHKLFLRAKLWLQNVVGHSMFSYLKEALSLCTIWLSVPVEGLNGNRKYTYMLLDGLGFLLHPRQFK